MTTHPETAAGFADSDKCICCERSKSGGSFFELKVSQALHGLFCEQWEADIDVFREASRQGCRRCTVAFDMVTTWKQENPKYDWRYIIVTNGIALDSMVAEVHLRFSESRDTKSYKEKSIVLGLLSGNRRCPKQRSHRLCGYSMSNESKTGIHWAWWRISGINGTSSQGLCHMKTLRLIMRYKSVSAG